MKQPPSLLPAALRGLEREAAAKLVTLIIPTGILSDNISQRLLLREVPCPPRPIVRCRRSSLAIATVTSPPRRRATRPIRYTYDGSEHVRATNSLSRTERRPELPLTHLQRCPSRIAFAVGANKETTDAASSEINVDSGGQYRIAGVVTQNPRQWRRLVLPARQLDVASVSAAKRFTARTEAKPASSGWKLDSLLIF
jgi:hypothetical protein